MEYAIQSFNLDKVYRRKKVLENVSINVPRGSIYGLVGRNGAGKTTLMRVLCGLAEVSEGNYKLFNSEDLNEGYKRIGILIENPGIFNYMTALEDMEYFRKLYGVLEQEVSKEILEAVGLEWKDKKKVKNFSLGMKQRLGIAISLIGNPDLLILDEPINGLDPQGVFEIRKLLIKLNEERGITILISSHILSELFKMATNYGIIEKGKLIREVTKEQLEEDCRRCIKIKIDKEDVIRVVEILEIKLNIQEYDVLEDGLLRVFSDENIIEINRVLEKENIKIYSLSYSGEEIEEYFIRIIEGEKDEKYYRC
ncbi:ATP-binding cassette domain-containing protein [uncultured Clostridium sp.]|uniref:ATP-binding cassette domain-containing protein n=1 Tax=uncultured Clostridium sp. TaxID=59620 RepID=UPI00261A305A|nr:ATP-binding cassette domain-containing protein [uncultured Clostridium sp.]